MKKSAALFVSLMVVAIAGCNKNNGEDQPVIPKGAVDMGIVMTRADGTTYPLYWAECNLGASVPEEVGDFYAWGEVEPKSSYSWENYKYCVIDPSAETAQLSKYNTRETYGPVDGKTVLEPGDDAAHVKLGGKWRIPTREEFTALRSQCTWTWNTHGTFGFYVKSNHNGNTIYLPASGIAVESGIYNKGTYFVYGSSSLNPDSPAQLFTIRLRGVEVEKSSLERLYGLPIRPVTE
jgi:hypothetical protein